VAVERTISSAHLHHEAGQYWNVHYGSLIAILHTFPEGQDGNVHYRCCDGHLHTLPVLGFSFLHVFPGLRVAFAQTGISFFVSFWSCSRSHPRGYEMTIKGSKCDSEGSLPVLTMCEGGYPVPNSQAGSLTGPVVSTFFFTESPKQTTWGSGGCQSTWGAWGSLPP
jgi:hypothetical protein